MAAIDPDFDDCPDLTKSAPTLLSDFRKRLDEALRIEVKSEDNSDADSLVSQIEPFQDSPQLIDPILEESVILICRALLRDKKKWHFRVLYVLVKIRGAKTVSKFLFNDVALVEKITYAVEECKEDESSWEERYILLLWLAGLSLTPFKLETVGSDISARLYASSQKYLGTAGREREAAATLIARLITRPDTLQNFLPKFIDDANTTARSSIFKTLGTASAIAQMLVLGEAHALQPYLNDLSLLHQSLRSNSEVSSNNQLRKLLCKITYRLSLCALAVSVSEVPEIVDRCISELLTSLLVDKDTLVRYSASKAFSRVALAMAKIDSDGLFVKEIIDSLFLSSFPIDNIGDGKVADRWQGGLLALAELLRRHVLPISEYASQLFRTIHEGLRFEIRKATHAIGANVRDSACYAAWSLFRHYPNLLAESDTETRGQLQNILADLALVGCFDREINNRRAAAAAVQECIGRHPEAVESLEKGIALVQALDYFAIGNRTNAYLEVSRQVDKLGIMSDSNAMVDYLLEKKINSWDIDTRRLAARVVALLSKDKGVESQTTSTVLIMAERAVVSGSVEEQYGSLYALGELLTMSTDRLLLPRLVSLLKDLQFPPHAAMPLYEAALQVILSSSSLVSADMELPHIYQSILDNALSRTEQDTQTQALHAAASATAAQLQTSHINMTEWLENARVGKFGYMLALGNLGDKLPESIVSEILEIASSSEKQYAIAVRVASIDTLNSLLSSSVLDKSKALQALNFALQDYTILPTRGDTGSQIRLASMSTLTSHAKELFPATSKQDEMACLANLARIALEKMDKLRLHAIQCLYTIIPILTPSAMTAELANILGEKSTATEILEAKSSEYYQRLIPLCICASETVISRSALAGLAASVGGGTGESVVRASSDATVAFLSSDDEIDGEKRKKFVDNVVAAFTEKPEVITDTTRPSPPRREFELSDLVILLFETGSMKAYASTSVYVPIYNKAARLLILATKTNNVARMRGLVALFCGIVEVSVTGSKVKEAAAKKVVGVLIGNIRSVRFSV